MGFIHKITHSCKDAQMYVIKKEQNINIGLKNRLHLHLHVMFCKCCNLFVGQNEFINKLLKTKQKEQNPTNKLSSQKTEEIQKIIEKHLNEQ
jgi:hypothetical protein